MARKTKQTSVKQILNFSTKQISDMSDEKLRKIVVIANSAANKRIKRAEKAGLTSGIIEEAKEYGKFSVKGINKNNRAALEAQFFRVRNFLSKKTSKTRGIKSQQRKMFKELALTINKELPPDEKIDPTGRDEVDLQRISGLIWQQVDKLAEKKELGIDKTERYKLAAHAYKVTTRDKRPIKTKRGLFKNLEKFQKDMYKSSIAPKKLTKYEKGEGDIAEVYNNIER